jgi:hypothetical protein
MYNEFRISNKKHTSKGPRQRSSAAWEVEKRTVARSARDAMYFIVVVSCCCVVGFKWS